MGDRLVEAFGKILKEREYVGGDFKVNNEPEICDCFNLRKIADYDEVKERMVEHFHNVSLRAEGRMDGYKYMVHSYQNRVFTIHLFTFTKVWQMIVERKEVRGRGE